MKVFVNGSFDIIHTGHIELLYYAKSLGNHLHVAIDSDDRISRLKGADRPVIPLHIRKELILALKPVNTVSVFNTDTDLINTIRSYNPDIMVKGSDWKYKTIIGEEFCKRIVFYERVNSESTSKIIEDFINRRQLL